MRYSSTRGEADLVTFAGALVNGLAPDGGLYTPESIPTAPLGIQTYQQAMVSALEAFGAVDVAGIVSEAAAAFHHPDVAPIVEVGDRLVLELFHGPTLSFKDHALQVVCRLLAREVEAGVVLGATSGDTGSAAIEAISRTHLKIVMLFPEGRVSDFQRRQMTTTGDHDVRAVAVRGTFDDCQRMVKESFAANDHLLAVNSINFARVAAQVGYHLYASSQIGEPHDIVVPTGNFGNVYSAWLAKQMGAEIASITIANNSNHYLADLVNVGQAERAAVIPTIAPAMDIQVPSNFERFKGDPTTEFRASWSDDAQMRSTIARVDGLYGYRLDPHTATAWAAGDETKTDRPMLIVSTAHPAKFDDSIDPPTWFPSLEGRSEHFSTIDPDASELAHLLR